MPPPKRRCNFIHPKQFSPGKILSDYEEYFSFVRDSFTTWVKADPNDTFKRHMVDVRKAFAEYCEAPVRKQKTPAQECFFGLKRLSVYSWNQGPRRGKEGAVEKHIARKRHIITLLEAIDYFGNELLTNRFHVTHCHYAKKRGIGKKLNRTMHAVMLDENVDLVAGDFNGAAWRCRC